MNKPIRRTTAFALCIAVAVITFVSVSVLRRGAYDEALDLKEIRYSREIESLNTRYESLYALNHAMDILREAKEQVRQYYVFDVDEDAVSAALAEASYQLLFHPFDYEDPQTYLLYTYFSAIGDPFTMYHTPEEMQKLTEESEGRLFGIGIYVYLEPDGEHIYVNRVMNGSPAEKAGILAGDIIVSIEGTKVSRETYGESIAKVAGELGTEVHLKIVRDGETLDLSPVRGEVRTQSVFMEYIEEFAFITVMEFSGHVAEDFVAAVNEAEARGVSGYIFDMRDNPGGDLTIICDVLDRLLPEGPIVNVMDKDQNKVYSRNSDSVSVNKPMAVLCNGNTASAGELFTAALRDYDMAAVIGETTFGKGTMQTIIGLSDGSGVRITEYYYNPPYGENYNLKGITPDIILAESEYYKDRPFKRGSDEDEALKTAVAELRKQK